MFCVSERPCWSLLVSLGNVGRRACAPAALGSRAYRGSRAARPGPRTDRAAFAIALIIWWFSRTTRAPPGPRRGPRRSARAGAPPPRRPRLLGAAPPRVRQHRGQQRRLARAERAHRLVEGVAAAGLGAELPVRPPLRDVEIDFEHTPLGQHEIDPQRERQLQRLAHETAPRPQ